MYKASLLGCPVAVKENASSKENRVLGLRRDIAYLRRVAGGEAAAESSEAPPAARAQPLFCSSFPHPNIVQVLGAFELRDKRLYVVMGARGAASGNGPPHAASQSSWRTACARGAW